MSCDSRSNSDDSEAISRSLSSVSYGPPRLIELTGVEVEWANTPACLVSVHDVTDARRVAHAYSELLEKERALRALSRR